MCIYIKLLRQFTGVKYILLTILMTFLFDARSTNARTHTYKCGTVYVASNDGKQWSEYRESQIKMYVEFDYPRMAMEDSDKDQYFYTFSSYKKTYYKRDGRKLKKLIMKGLKYLHRRQDCRHHVRVR